MTEPNKSIPELLASTKDMPIVQPVLEAPKTALGHVIHRSEASTSTFLNFEGGISAKDPYNQSSYDYFRNGEKNPNCRKGILGKCEHVYTSFGIIQDIINLQTNFTCHGIRISHPTKRIEKICKAWFEAVGGKLVSQKIIHNLNLRGTACMTKTVAKLNAKKEKEFRATAAIDIVSSYNFIDPAIIEVEDADTASMLDEKRYFIKIDTKSMAKIKKALEGKQYIQEITKDKIYLNNEFFKIVHYKKDDWSLWSTPTLVSVFDDIDMIKKMELADKTIVDGAINKIRFFRLGNVEKNLIPDVGAFNKLNSFLQKNGNGSTTDIIWSEDISIEETKMEGFQFLGKEKFEPYIEKIFMAMGMPILAGSSRGTAQTGTLSLNALVKRLEHSRDILRDFWTKEFSFLKDELGFKKDIIIEFDYPNLGDESAHRAILIQMADRNLISDEALHYALNHNPELERVRSIREQEERKSGDRVAKTTPYNEGDVENFVLKNLAVKGLIDPAELGLDVKIIQPVAETNKMNGPISPGRPKNAKDSEPRKKKVFKAASYLQRAELLELTTNFVKPLVLSTFNRKNLRELSNNETDFYEDLRMSIFFSINNKNELSEDLVLSCLESEKTELFKEYKNICGELSKTTPLTFEQKNKIASIIHYEVL
jgi:hypothetical protein